MINNKIIHSKIKQIQAMLQITIITGTLQMESINQSEQFSIGQLPHRLEAGKIDDGKLGRGGRG